LIIICFTVGVISTDNQLLLQQSRDCIKSSRIKYCYSLRENWDEPLHQSEFYDTSKTKIVHFILNSHWYVKIWSMFTLVDECRTHTLTKHFYFSLTAHPTFLLHIILITWQIFKMQIYIDTYIEVTCRIWSV